jgi:predicted Zn-dependent protease
MFMSWIKNILALVFVAACAAGSVYLLNKGPCDAPLVYTLGDFDPKFGISKERFLADVKEAEDIWEAALGIDLFTYDLERGMPIHLVYDTRQKITDTNKVLKNQIDATEVTADFIKRDFLALKDRYEAAAAEYEALVAQFNERLNSYNSQVSYWNSRKGAPKAEYEKLATEKAELQTLRASMETKRLEAKAIADQVNALVAKYNYLVDISNADIRKINQTADREFEQGEYITDAAGQRIYVYEFDTNVKLVRLLTHEMGHSLGLGHNENSESIMYSVNSGTGLELSPEDVRDLKLACRIK